MDSEFWDSDGHPVDYDDQWECRELIGYDEDTGNVAWVEWSYM